VKKILKRISGPNARKAMGGLKEMYKKEPHNIKTASVV
jgi:hypothetical protein